MKTKMKETMLEKKLSNLDTSDDNYSGINYDEERGQWHYKVQLGKSFNYEGWYNTEEEAVKAHHDAIEDAKLYYI